MTSDEAEIFFSLLNTYFSTTLKIQILFLRQYATSSFFKHNFLSILAEFGRFCWCDFGRIDFWRVKRRQMRLSWKFSLLTRYFSTTLLYQIFFIRILYIFQNLRGFFLFFSLFFIITFPAFIKKKIGEDRKFFWVPRNFGFWPTNEIFWRKRQISTFQKWPFLGVWCRKSNLVKIGVIDMAYIFENWQKWVNTTFPNFFS